MANTDVEQKVAQMDSEKKERILQDFDKFKRYLGDKVHKGEKLGLSEEQLAKATEKVANYLAAHEEPRNAEEHLLHELWKVGDKEHQRALAHMLVRLVQ